MILVVTLDNSNGMMFNNRRQSRDRVLIDDLMTRLGNDKLLVNSFSEELFGENYSQSITVCDNPLEAAQTGDYCFVENLDIAPYRNKIEKMLIYRWNRDYPGDMFFPFEDITSNLICEFVGSSHDNITLEEGKLINE